VDVNEVLLPGVGLRYELTIESGDRLGIVVGRAGHVDVVSYPADDPDQSQLLFRLTPQEADTVAEILGAPRIAERFADLTKEVPGLASERIEIPADSPYAGRPLGHTRARTRTGASIVAVVRGRDVIASPGPDAVLHPGDVLVVIGTLAGIAGVDRLVHGS
jgi:TrkA domain protein